MKTIKNDLFPFLLFLYFFTLHADQLGFSCAGFHFRINNILALLLFITVALQFKFHLLTIDKSLFFALLLFSFSILLSFLFSSYKPRCLVFMGWYGLTLLCYVLLPYFLVKLWDVEKLLYLYGLSFVCVGVYALLQLILSCLKINDPFTTQHIIGSIVRPNAFAYEPSFYALYMTPFIMMINFHYLFAPKTPFLCFKELNSLKVSFLNALFLISTATSAFFAYLLFFLCILFAAEFYRFKGRVFKFLLAFACAGGSLFIAAPFLIKKFFMKFFFLGFMQHHSFYHRWVGITNAWQVFMDHFLLGVGFGGVPAYIYDAWGRGNTGYLFFDAYLSDMQGNYLKHFEPMNVMTEILASLGIVGLLAVGVLLFAIYLQARKAIDKAPTLSRNLLISVVVMLIVLQFNQGILRSYIWVHFSLAYALFELLASNSCSFPLSNQKTLDHVREKGPEFGSF
jgi:hypothetical protein